MQPIRQTEWRRDARSAALAVGGGGERGSASGALLIAVLALALALTAAIGYAAWHGDLLTADSPDPSSRTPPPTGPVSPTTSPGIELPMPSSPLPVLAEPAAGPPLSPVRLDRRIAPLLADPALRRHVGLMVAPLTAGGPTWAPAGAPNLVTPASTLKLLTVTTALELLGPGHVFQTSTTMSRASPHTVVLVGGGDPLLTDKADPSGRGSASYPPSANLEDLAELTAAALRARGVSKVALGYDDTLFIGPAVNPRWPGSYLADDVVSPITSLWVDEGRAVDGYAQRVPDPSAEAARRFAVLLERAGITVRGEVVPRPAPRRGRTLGSVSSAPLAQIVQHVLELSDNEGAEVLLRQSAIAAGRRGSFAAGADVMEQTVEDLGVDLRSARLYDGSGLSRQDLLPVGALVHVLQLAAEGARPELRSVVSSLPVAGFTGSLDYRFVDDAPSGLGLVRAKTGTLTGVHALAGVVVTADGEPLAFAAVADQVPVRLTLVARAQLDRIAAALATCSCGRSTR